MVSDHSVPKETILVIDKAEIFEINKPVVKIGRSAKNDLILKRIQVSRNHAEIRYSNHRFVIFDLGSLVGTKVNGQKIKRRILSKGDVIEIADVLLIFGHNELFQLRSSSGYSSPKGFGWKYRGTRFLGRSDDMK